MEIRNIIRCLPFILFIVDVWWKHYGGKLPELQKLVVRVLSQTCSSSGVSAIGVSLKRYTPKSATG
jgi:hypothetical protein